MGLVRPHAIEGKGKANDWIQEPFPFPRQTQKQEHGSTDLKRGPPPSSLYNA